MWKAFSIWSICFMSMVPFGANLAVLIDYSEDPKWYAAFAILAVSFIWVLLESGYIEKIIRG